MLARAGIALIVVSVGLAMMLVIAAAPTRRRAREVACALHADAQALLAQALQDANSVLFFQHAIEARCYARALRALVDRDVAARAAIGADVRALGERVDRVVRIATLALHKAAPSLFAELGGEDGARRARIDRTLAPPTAPLTRVAPTTPLTGVASAAPRVA